MTPNEEKEALELAKKCGAELAVSFDGENLAQFTGKQLLAFVSTLSALREKCEEQRLQIERDTECIERIRDKAAQLEVQNAELQCQLSGLT